MDKEKAMTTTLRTVIGTLLVIAAGLMFLAVMAAAEAATFAPTGTDGEHEIWNYQPIYGPIETVTITADNQGDAYIDHPDEPFTVTTGNCAIRVTTEIETPIYIDAVAAGVVAPTPEQEAIIDDFGTDFTLTLDPTVAESWAYTVVVIVNNHSQVSNLKGTVGCQ